MPHRPPRAMNPRRLLSVPNTRKAAPAAVLALLVAAAPVAVAHNHAKPAPSAPASQTAQDNETSASPDAPASPAMRAAIADAQASFGAFWAAYEAQAPGTDRFAVKVRLLGGNDTAEDLWVTDLAAAPNGQYTGALGNAPDILDRTYARGDTVTFAAADVVDWGYAEGSRLRGHFTTRVLIPDMDAAEAEQIESLLHDDPIAQEE